MSFSRCRTFHTKQSIIQSLTYLASCSRIEIMKQKLLSNKLNIEVMRWNRLFRRD